MDNTKRQVDDELRAKYRTLRCLVCDTSPCDPCHIKTVGSGGHDHANNLMPLCRDHHTEQHRIGLFSFIERHANVGLYISTIGLKIIKLHGKNYILPREAQ